MKKLAKCLLCLSSCILVLASCNGKNSSESSTTSSTSHVVDSAIEILNKDLLTQTWFCGSGDRYIQLKAKGIENTIKAVENKIITIESSNPNVVTVVGQYLKAVNEGSTTIKVSLGDQFDSVDVLISEPSDKTPRFYIDYSESDQYKNYVDREVKLPNYTCVDYKGNDISNIVTISSDLDKDAIIDVRNNTFKSSVKGHHNISFCAKQGEFEVVKTIQIALYKELLATGRGGSYKVQVGDELTDNPYIYVACAQKDSGIEARAFNVTPSKIYYAEAYFKKPTTSGIGFGLIHSKESTQQGFTREWLSIPNINKAEVDVRKAYNYGSGQYVLNVYPAKLLGLIGDEPFDIGEIVNNTYNKIAIARIENDYYFFVNDFCYSHYISSEYEDINTLPGIVCSSWITGINGNSAKDIYVCDGNEAVQKVDSLKGNFHQYGYARNDSNLSYNCGSYDANNKVLTYRTINGSQNYYNSIVMNTKNFKGSTHIKFRYEATAISTVGGSDDYSTFFVGAMDNNFSNDPNSKLSQICKASIRHNATYNTTFFFGANQYESPWNSEAYRFSGNGTDYHYDVNIWDIDLKIKVTGTQAVTSISMIEIAKKSGSETVYFDEAERKIYESGDVASTYVMPDSDVSAQPWLGLFFQGHNTNGATSPSEFKISNLMIETLE